MACSSAQFWTSDVSPLVSLVDGFWPFWLSSWWMYDGISRDCEIAANSRTRRLIAVASEFFPSSPWCSWPQRLQSHRGPRVSLQETQQCSHVPWFFSSSCHGFYFGNRLRLYWRYVYHCTDSSCTSPHLFLEPIGRLRQSISAPICYLKLIRRSHHTIVMDKLFSFRILLASRLARGGAGNTRCNMDWGQPLLGIWHRFREKHSAPMWTSKYLAAVGLPFGINLEITPLHRSTTVFFEFIWGHSSA